MLGAHVTIFSRSPGPLEKAKHEIKDACKSKEQIIKAVSLDMSDAPRVRRPFCQAMVTLQGFVY